MRLILLVGVLASAVLNAVALLVGRGSFVHWFAVLVVAIYAGGTALVLGACAYVLRTRFRFAVTLARVATLVAVVLASTVISLLPGRELAKHDIATAKTYCDTIIWQLERDKRTSGVYPPDLSAFWRQGDGPLLVRRSLHYWSDGVQYQLTFIDPRGVMNFVSYGSTVRRWSEWD